MRGVTSSRQHTGPVTCHLLPAVLLPNFFLLQFLFFQVSRCTEEVEANETHLKQRSPELKAPTSAETQEPIQTSAVEWWQREGGSTHPALQTEAHLKALGNGGIVCHEGIKT